MKQELNNNLKRIKLINWLKKKNINKNYKTKSNNVVLLSVIQKCLKTNQLIYLKKIQRIGRNNYYNYTVNYLMLIKIIEHSEAQYLVILLIILKRIQYKKLLNLIQLIVYNKNYPPKKHFLRKN